MSVVSHWHWHQWICVAKVGEGILSLPAGIAAGTGIVTALLIMTAFYIVTWPRSPTLDVLEGGGGGCMSLSRPKIAVILVHAPSFFGGSGPHSRHQVMMYSFWSIGRCCHATGSKTHGEVGFAVRGGKVFPFVMEVGVRLSQEELGAVPSAFICLFASWVIYSNELFDNDTK